MEIKKERSPDKVFHCGPVRAAIWIYSKVHNNAVVEPRKGHQGYVVEGGKYAMQSRGCQYE